MAHMPPAGSNRGVAVRRPRLGLWVLLGFVALSLVGQAVPLYTDWLWFQEVRFTGIYATMLSLKILLGASAGLVVFLTLYLNLLATRAGRGPVVEVPGDDLTQLPSWSLVSLDDKAIDPGGQRFMAERAHAHIATVRSAHDVMVSHPGAVVRVIQAAAVAVG